MARGFSGRGGRDDRGGRGDRARRGGDGGRGNHEDRGEGYHGDHAGKGRGDSSSSNRGGRPDRGGPPQGRGDRPSGHGSRDCGCIAQVKELQYRAKELGDNIKTLKDALVIEEAGGDMSLGTTMFVGAGSLGRIAALPTFDDIATNIGQPLWRLMTEIKADLNPLKSVSTNVANVSRDVKQLNMTAQNFQGMLTKWDCRIDDMEKRMQLMATRQETTQILAKAQLPVVRQELMKDIETLLVRMKLVPQHKAPASPLSPFNPGQRLDSKDDANRQGWQPGYEDMTFTTTVDEIRKSWDALYAQQNHILNQHYSAEKGHPDDGIPQALGLHKEYYLRYKVSCILYEELLDETSVNSKIYGFCDLQIDRQLGAAELKIDQIKTFKNNDVKTQWRYVNALLAHLADNRPEELEEYITDKIHTAMLPHHKTGAFDDLREVETLWGGFVSRAIDIVLKVRLSHARYCWYPHPNATMGTPRELVRVRDTIKFEPRPKEMWNQRCLVLFPGLTRGGGTYGRTDDEGPEPEVVLSRPIVVWFDDGSVPEEGQLGSPLPPPSLSDLPSPSYSKGSGGQSGGSGGSGGPPGSGGGSGYQKPRADDDFDGG